jgi:hypothetical protein
MNCVCARTQTQIHTPPPRTPPPFLHAPASGGLAQGMDGQEDVETGHQVDESTLQNLLDPLAELREMLDPDHDGHGGGGGSGGGCFKLAKGGVRIETRRVVSVASGFSYEERCGRRFMIAPLPRIEKAVTQFVDGHCKLAGVGKEAMVQILRKWRDFRVLEQPARPGMEDGLARAAGVLAHASAATLEEACVRCSLRAVSETLCQRYKKQGERQRRDASEMLHRIVHKGNGHMHRQWDAVLKEHVSMVRNGMLHPGVSWRVLQVALQVMGKEGQLTNKIAQGLSVHLELKRGLKDVAAGAARSLLHDDDYVRLECVRVVTRLATAQVLGHPHLRLSLLPDPTRGRSHPALPPPLRSRIDVQSVGRFTQETTFYTRCVRHAMRDASALVRRSAVLEARTLAEAQGTCGRWYGSDARMLLSDRCECVRRAAVKALVNHCTFFRLPHAGETAAEAKERGGGREEVGAWDLESALALQGPSAELGRGSIVQLEFGAQSVVAFDPNRGLEGGARLMLTVRRYRGPARAPPPPSTDLMNSEAPQSDSEEEEEEAQQRNSAAGVSRGGGGGVQSDVDAEEKEVVKTSKCPPPPLEHEWHPPLVWHWEELCSTEARRHDEGVCVWEAMEVELETLLCHGHEATLFVKVWELHGKGTGIEAALEYGEVVGSMQLSAGRLLEVGRVPITPAGTRVALELRGMELKTKVPAVDSSPLQPLLTVKTTNGRLVYAAQGRFVPPSEPLTPATAQALSGTLGDDDASEGLSNEADSDDEPMEAQKAAEAARAQKRAAQQGWYEWTPMSLSAESCGENPPWHPRPASMHDIIQMGAAWKLEVCRAAISQRVFRPKLSFLNSPPCVLNP